MNDVGFRLYATDDVSGPAGRARSSLLSLGHSASTVSGGLGKIGSGAAVAAKNLALMAIPVVLALGGLAVSSVNAARQFQASMVLIQTQAGASADEVTNMSAAVLKLAPQVGMGPDVLAAGLYHVESAGLRGAKALEILRVAAEGAKVGNADLESVTNALIAANQSGVKGVEDMAGAMGSLNAIVGAGNMRMQDLTDAMGTGVLSTAKNYGVTLQSVGAALASMTDQGIPAVDAATRLNSAMRLMAAPTSKAVSELKSIGLSQFALATDMRGPGGIDAAIHDLKDHLDKSGLSLTQQAALIAAAFGGKQSGAILTLIGNVGLLDAKVAAVNKGAGAFGDAWAATGQTVAEQQAQVSASLDSLKIQLGTELLPVEQRVLKGLTDLLSSDAVQNGIVDLGKGINDMFSADNISGAEKFIQDVIPGIEGFAKTALPPFIAGLKLAGQITKQAFDMFNQLPEPLKAAIIGGLAVNKLSGGLIGSGVMDIIKATAGGAAGGSGVGGGVLGGLLGVQKVFVVNMGMGGMGGGLGGAAGEAGTLGEGAAAGEAGAGGMGAGAILGTVAAVAAAAVLTGIAVHGWAELPTDVHNQQGDANSQITSWKVSQTTPQQNVDALKSAMAAWQGLQSNPLTGGLTNLVASHQGQDNLTAAADKIAEGVSITPEGISAIQDALTQAQGNSALSGAIPGLQADLAKANLLMADQVAGGGRSTAAQHADAVQAEAAAKTAKVAITNALSMVKLDTSSSAASAKWSSRDITTLLGVQKGFAASGDKVTAAALGVDIATLQAALGGKLAGVTAAIGRIPGGGPVAGGGGSTRYAPETINPGGTTVPGSTTPLPVNLRTNVNVTVTSRSVGDARTVAGRYGAGVPQ